MTLSTDEAIVSNLDKIITKFRNSNKGHKFEDCLKILESLGYEMKAGKGSHFKFIKKGRPLIMIARHNPVSPDAVDDVIEEWDKNNS